jgi:hypothetical protein
MRRNGAGGDDGAHLLTLRPAHDQIDLPAAAFGADERLPPIMSVLPRQFSTFRFDPMAAVAAPHDQVHSGYDGAAQCHRWPGSDFTGGTAVPDAAHAPGLLPVSAVAPVGGGRRSRQLREFGATAGYAPTAGTVVFDDRVEFFEECLGFLHGNACLAGLGRLGRVERSNA